MVGKAFVKNEGIRMGVCKFIIRTLTCLGYVIIILNDDAAFDSLFATGTKRVSKSYKQDNMGLRRAVSESCSGVQNEVFPSQNSQLRPTHSTNTQ